jgi:hypothetical protein
MERIGGVGAVTLGIESGPDFRARAV